MPPPLPSPALAAAIAAGDLASAIRALDASLGEGGGSGSGNGAGSGAQSTAATAATLANRALCHERLGMHRKAIKASACVCVMARGSVCVCVCTRATDWPQGARSLPRRNPPPFSSSHQDCDAALALVPAHPAATRLSLLVIEQAFGPVVHVSVCALLGKRRGGGRV